MLSKRTYAFSRVPLESGWGYARQPNLAEKVRWIAEQTARPTGLSRFGQYLTLFFEADMLAGNEDRHLNNIAVLCQGEGFDYCPLFDFGAGLLSNTRDYLLAIEPRAHLRLHALPLGTTFGRQVGPGRPSRLRPPAGLGLYRR